MPGGLVGATLGSLMASLTIALLGPPVIGSIAQQVGMQAAIGYVGALSLLIALLASRTRLLK